MKEELLEVYISYQGNFVMGSFCTDLAKTLIPREKEASDKEYTPTIHPGVSQLENNQDHLCRKPQDPNPG